jgi:hypothetical protein
MSMVFAKHDEENDIALFKEVEHLRKEIEKYNPSETIKNLRDKVSQQYYEIAKLQDEVNEIPNLKRELAALRKKGDENVLLSRCKSITSIFLHADRLLKQISQEAHEGSRKINNELQEVSRKENEEVNK